MGDGQAGRQRATGDPQREQQALLNSLSAHMAIIDRQGRIETVNDAWRTFAAENLPVGANVCEGANYLEACDRAAAEGSAIAAEFGAAIRDVLAGRRESFEGEYDCHSPGVQRWFVARVTRYADRSDRAVVAHTDVTPRKKALADFRDSEIRLRLALEAGRAATFDWDLGSQRLTWSRGHEELRGIAPGAFRGTYADFLATLHPDDRELVKAALTRSIVERTTYRCEYRVIWPDGSVHWISAQGEPLYGDDGRPLRMVGLVRDVTPVKKADERCQQLQLQLAHLGRVSTLGEMVAGIAHEISQPLYSIGNFAEATRNVLADESPRWEELRQWNEQIATQAARAGEIIERLRGFAARTQTRRTLTRLGVIVDEAISLVAGEARRHGVAIRREAFDPDPQVEVDPGGIAQVLVNLLRNACEAMAESNAAPRQVLISARTVGPGVEVTVADNGPGLADADDRRIFEPFLTTKASGLGMGLAISRTIIEAHAGHIWASRASEGGAKFHFSLPQAPADERPACDSA